MRRFIIGLAKKEDIKEINIIFIRYNNVSLPPITKLRCDCYANDRINTYTNTIFIQHLRATHTKAVNNVNTDDDTVP